ncbi:MAG: hypothetical protein Q7V15_13420 [Phenylobacterium sp.]|uniref:hypothetical protein n=1 Tax=Phenylobacterium sp. TaxID=1871053 RepID=UPI0027158054|nr:hypothetical protein [Phenylobacterium sp.]MDO8902341.1 hypothetical protein [Phenylobacterium sp.]
MARPMIVSNADIKFARNTLRSFVENVALSRALLSIEKPPYALRLAQGSAFDIAAIEWCILFGSDHARLQHIHWKNMFDEDRFRDGLLEFLTISKTEWKSYRQNLVNYRNELAAHRDLDPVTGSYPSFETGLSAAAFYNEKLVELANTRGVSLSGPTLMEHFEVRAAEFREWASSAVN